MGETDIGGIAEAFWKALEDRNWDAADSYLHEDFVQEWPQSGERIIGAVNCLAINENYPGGLPAMVFRRTTSGGDVAVVEVQLTYSDGSVYEAVSVMEFRDGKIVKETDYFAAPFAAPQWRAQWVERI